MGKGVYGRAAVCAQEGSVIAHRRVADCAQEGSVIHGRAA